MKYCGSSEHSGVSQYRHLGYPIQHLPVIFIIVLIPTSRTQLLEQCWYKQPPQ